MSDEPDRGARLDAIVSDYFEVRTSAIIDRAVRLLGPEQLYDDDAAAQLGDDLLDALERRYGRMDDGWREATEELVRVELERTVGERRRAHDALEAELEG